MKEFGGIESNPAFETLMGAVELVQREGIDFLLAVGGGSVLDGTKFIAAAARFEGDPWTILSRRMPVRAAVPYGTVLTLPATGSEMNSGAVISRRSTQEKLAFSSPLVFPKFSIVDPETTYSLPPPPCGQRRGGRLRPRGRAVRDGTFQGTAAGTASRRRSSAPWSRTARRPWPIPPTTTRAAASCGAPPWP